MPKTIIPELEPLFQRYGCQLKDKPPYVLWGSYYSGVKMFGGILAYTQNEIYARILKREISKNGTCTIETTEYHSTSTTFSLAIYKEQLLKSKEQNV